MSQVLHRYQDVLWAVDVCLGDGPSERFLLDTGAGLTILDIKTATQQGLSPWGRLTGHKMSGQRVDFQQVDPVPLRIGDQQLDLNGLAVTDLGTLLPPGWPPVAGVLALDAFHAQAVTLDFARAALTLESPESLAARVSTAGALRVRIARQAQGASLDLFVRVGGDNQRPTWLEIDSGNTGPTLLAPHSIDLLGLSGDGGNTELVFAEDFRESAAWEKADIIIDGNLGQSFLNTHALSLDLKSARAWLA